MSTYRERAEAQTLMKRRWLGRRWSKWRYWRLRLPLKPRLSVPANAA